MKREIRVLGIDDCPHSRKDKEVTVIGCLFRGGDWLDGVMSTSVEVDGENATVKLIELINRSSFKRQIQCLFLDGIAFGGFNVVNIHGLHQHTGIPVIVVVRRLPDFESIKNALRQLGMEKKYQLIEQAGQPARIPIKDGEIFIQTAGISIEDAKKLLTICCTRSYLPEAVRVAHLIGAGIVNGESKGGA